MSSNRPVVVVAIKGLGIGGAEKLIVEGSRFWDRDRFDYRVAYALPWKDQLVETLRSRDVPVQCFGTK
ncbi:MAG: glycosyltransferase, partial [Acidimicrobiia bacterium]